MGGLGVGSRAFPLLLQATARTPHRNSTTLDSSSILPIRGRDGPLSSELPGDLLCGPGLVLALSAPWLLLCGPGKDLEAPEGSDGEISACSLQPAQSQSQAQGQDSPTPGAGPALHIS